MLISNRSGDHRYRLVVRAGGEDTDKVIDFSARGPESALYLAQRHCAGREADLYQEGRALGRVRHDLNGGFWVITPPVPASLPGAPTRPLPARDAAAAGEGQLA